MNLDVLVESKIHGISIEPRQEGSDVVLSIVDNDGVRWRLVASSVSDMLATEMRTQNIIDHVVIVGASDEANDSVRQKVYYLLRGKDAETKSDLRWKGVEAVLHDISMSNKCLIEVEPVYGVYVLLIAKSISLERELR